MEVMPGYKQTEVGVIPEDWDCTTVGQLAQNGTIHKPMDGNHGNIHPKSGDFVSFGIPFVMANNVRNGSVDLSNCSFIRKEQADSLQKGFSLPGDVLLTHKATIGNTAVVGEIPVEYIMLTPQVTYYRVADTTRLNNRYLRHYFDSASFQKVLISLSGGGTRAYIGITAQHHLPVVVPSLPEQEAIAEALSDADALIESLEQLIAKKRHLKQGAMQELLTGKRRLPGFANATIGYKQTEVEVIPEDWEVTKLSNIGDVIRGASPRPKGDKRYYGGEIPRLMVEDVTRDGKFVVPLVDFLTEEGAKRSRPCKKGTLTIVCSGTVGVVSFLGVDACIHDGFLALTGIRKSVSDDYLYHQLCRLQESFDTSATHGGIFTNLTTSGVKEFKLSIPPTKAEQEAIAAVLSDMDAEIAALEAKLAKARQLKQGMMHNLLTGRIRLK